MVARTGLFVAPLPGATPAGTSPTDGRLVLASFFGAGAGCMTGGSLTASTTAMQVTVGQSVWRIPDPTNTAAVYLSPADPYVFTLSAGPASGSRIDALWVRQNNFEAGDADSRVTYGVAAGVAAATPAVPAVPAGAMRIANVTVPTGAANAAACTIAAQLAQIVAPPNIIVATEAQLPAAGAFVGQLATVQAVTLGATVAVVERWNGTAWRRWDSDYVGFIPGFSGLTGAAYATPGWVPGGRFRYTGGKIRYEFAFMLNSAMTTSQIQATVPIPADQYGAYNSGSTSPLQRGLATTGRAWGSRGGRWFDFSVGWQGANLQFLNVNSAQYMDGQGGTWSQSDELVGVIEYDPA